MQKPSNLILFLRAIHSSISNIFRNKFLSIATVVVMGTILFIFNIILAVNFITESSLARLSEKVDLVLYLRDNITVDQTAEVVKEIKMVDGVVSVSLTSKEDALEKVKNMYPNLYQSFEKYDLKNPLPASISVKTIDPSVHQQIENFIKGSRISGYITNISASEGQRNEPSSPEFASSTTESDIISSVSKNLEKVTNFSRQIIFYVVIIFIVGGVLIILNAIQMAIFTRRKEIQIMRLVGATTGFIKLPFVIEGIFYAVFSVLLNLVLLSFLSGRIDIEGTTLATYGQNFNLTGLILFEFLITIILAICSSLLAVHNHLRKNT